MKTPWFLEQVAVHGDAQCVWQLLQLGDLKFCTHNLSQENVMEWLIDI